MRPLPLVLLTLVFIACGMAAHAAPAGRAPRDASKLPVDTPPEELKKRAAQYLDQCMQDWEPATHMTKQEWRRTCERVARERLKFLMDQAKGGGQK
jgi:hypothetical protein